MSDVERPDHALLLDLNEVLRRFGDRQREMLAVVRQLHAQWPAAAGALRQPASPPDAPTPAAPTPAASIPASPGPLPSAITTAVPDVTVPVAPAPLVEDPESLTLRTKRDYDYFEELDVRLARLRQDEDPEIV